MTPRVALLLGDQAVAATPGTYLLKRRGVEFDFDGIGPLCQRFGLDFG